MLVLCFFISACVSYNIWNPPRVERLDPMELFGADGAVLRGRLFSSFCESNVFGNAATARNTAIINAAKRAYDLGFPYFTIIWDSNGLRTSTFDTVQSHSRNNYTITTHNYTFYAYKCIFIILKSDEMEGWDNIYTVSRYVR